MKPCSRSEYYISETLTKGSLCKYISAPFCMTEDWLASKFLHDTLYLCSTFTPFFLNSIHKGKVCFKACNLICWQLARVITFLELINSSRAYISVLWKTNLPTSLARYQVIWIYPLGNSLLIYCIFCQTCN